MRAPTLYVPKTPIWHYQDYYTNSRDHDYCFSIDHHLIGTHRARFVTIFDKSRQDNTATVTNYRQKPVIAVFHTTQPSIHMLYVSENAYRTSWWSRDTIIWRIRVVRSPILLSAPRQIANLVQYIAQHSPTIPRVSYHVAETLSLTKHTIFTKLHKSFRVPPTSVHYSYISTSNRYRDRPFPQFYGSRDMVDHSINVNCTLFWFYCRHRAFLSLIFYQFHVSL